MRSRHLVLAFTALAHGSRWDAAAASGTAAGGRFRALDIPIDDRALSSAARNLTASRTGA